MCSFFPLDRPLSQDRPFGSRSSKIILGHYFPQFCSGPCNGLSRESAQKIFETAKQTETNGFRLEDVLFLGIIREKAKMEIPHFEKVFIQMACTS